MQAAGPGLNWHKFHFVKHCMLGQDFMPRVYWQCFTAAHLLGTIIKILVWEALFLPCPTSGTSFYFLIDALVEVLAKLKRGGI